MKYDEDYEVLDNNFTKEIFYISSNPTLWGDESVQFIFDGYKAKEKTNVRFSYKVFVDGKYMGIFEFIDNYICEPGRTYRTNVSLELRELSIAVKKGQVEIKDIVGLSPTSDIEVTTGGALDKHKGIVTVIKIPKITGGKDLGRRYKSFSFQSSLDSDSSRQTKVTAILEGQTIYSTIGTSTTHDIVVKDEVFKKLALNKQYSITVKAEDSQNSSKNSSTTFTFTKIEEPPSIDIQDKDFGKIAKKPTIQYTITKGTGVTAYEKINGETIRSFKPSIGEKYDFEITDEKWKELTPNKLTTATLEVEDTYGQTVKRTFTFTKLSDPPALNIEDKDFGKILSKPIIEYSLTKGENVTIREKIEDEETRNFKATIGETYQFEISDEDWKEFSPNKVIKTTIEAENEYGQVTTKTFTFEKIITRIEIKGKAPTQTDDKVTKVLLRPILRSMEGVKTVNIYACNNGLDNEPTWEDISENSLLHNVSFLENNDKTSEEWAFNLKIVIEREEDYDGEIILDALGGAFE